MVITTERGRVGRGRRRDEGKGWVSGDGRWFDFRWWTHKYADDVI